MPPMGHEASTECTTPYGGDAPRRRNPHEATVRLAHPGRDARGRRLLEFEQQHLPVDRAGGVRPGRKCEPPPPPVDRAFPVAAGVAPAADVARDVAGGQPERFLID